MKNIIKRISEQVCKQYPYCEDCTFLSGCIIKHDLDTIIDLSNKCVKLENGLNKTCSYLYGAQHYPQDFNNIKKLDAIAWKEMVLREEFKK